MLCSSEQVFFFVYLCKRVFFQYFSTDWLNAAPSQRGKTFDLFCCLYPGLAGAADIHCAGNWPLNWPRFHSCQGRSFPTRAQGMWDRQWFNLDLWINKVRVFGIMKNIPFVFVTLLFFKSQYVHVFSHYFQFLSVKFAHKLKLLPPGDPAGWLLWASHQSLCGRGLQAERPPAADDFPGPNQNSGWVCSADALCCQGRWRKPKGMKTSDVFFLPTLMVTSGLQRLTEDVYLLLLTPDRHPIPMMP